MMDINSDGLAKLLEKAGLPRDPSQVVGRKVCIAVQIPEDDPDAREFIFSTIANINFFQTGLAKSAQPGSLDQAIRNLHIYLASGQMMAERHCHQLCFLHNDHWIADIGPFMTPTGHIERCRGFDAEVTVLD